MPRISKKTLIESVITAITNAGWQVERLSSVGEYPTRLRMNRAGKTYTTRVYVWNLTHGGGSARPAHEYRIQVTSGVSRFEIESGEKTLILGWSAEFGVFACFDATRHAGRLGSSPSIQIGKSALLRASDVGVAAHTRGQEEIAIAIRPDLFTGYVERLELLHHKSSFEQQISELQRDGNPREGIIAEAAAEAMQVEKNLHDGRHPRLGDYNEIKQRKTIVDRLEVIERHLGLTAQQPAAIGHNYPPEPIDVEVSEDAREEILNSARAISEHISKSPPEVEKIVAQTSLLTTVASKIWPKSLIGVGKSIFEKIAVTIVSVGIKHLATPYYQQIGAALESIVAWLRMLF